MDLKNKNVLVTGGAGAIGSNLVRKLIEDFQCQVVVIDDLSSEHNCLGDLKDKLDFYHTSILNDDMVDKIFASHEFNVVFHLAALFANQKSVDQPKEDLMVNGLGTLKILQYCKKYNVERVIFTSSSCVYGNKDIEDKEDDYEVNLDTPYAITKLLGEKYCDYFYHHYGVNTVVLRIFNCYGPSELPGKYRNVIPNFFKSALNKRILTIYGTGEETRSYTYVEDTVQMIIKSAMAYDAIGQVINIGNEVETKTIDLATKINDLCGNKDNIIYIPQRGWDTIKRRKANIDKAKKILGYKPLTGLDEGLRKTYDWFIQHPEFWKDEK
jgi:nucleoside-diphosphate-sugar epimerase